MNAFYLQRITKVVDFIEENLDQKLSLDQLAEVAMFSKYHFHRIFKSVIDETLNDYIKRIRMIHAYRFLQADKSLGVSELAYRLGYQSPANFSRDFKAFHGISATVVKKSGKMLEQRPHEFKGKNLNVVYKGIQQISDMFVVYKKVTTGYDTHVISGTFTELYHLALKHDFTLKQFIGIGYDDPDYTPANKCKYDACMVVNKNDIPKNIEYNTKTVKGGKFAVFFFEGHEKDIALAWDYMFKKWLLNSEYIPDDRPHMEMYEYSELYEQGIFKVNLCLPIKSICNI